jgi:hypothetical protein
VQAHVSLQEADSPQLLYLFISPGYSWPIRKHSIVMEPDHSYYMIQDSSSSKLCLGTLYQPSQDFLRTALCGPNSFPPYFHWGQTSITVGRPMPSTPVPFPGIFPGAPTLGIKLLTCLEPSWHLPLYSENLSHQNLLFIYTQPHIMT